MHTRTIQAFCHSGDLARIEEAVRDWPGVEAVGTLRAKGNRKDTTSVFIKFESEDAASNHISLINSIPGLLQTVSDEKNNESAKSTKTPKVYPKNLAAEFMQFEAHGNRKQAPEQRGRRQYENNQRGDGGRGRRNNHYGRQYDKGNRRQYNFIPPVNVCVAFADNVPFNTTIEQLNEVFSPYGRVLDINRYDLIAMVLYESPESVALAIQNINGKKIKGNVVSVSSGSIRIPGPASLQMGVQQQ